MLYKNQEIPFNYLSEYTTKELIRNVTIEEVTDTILLLRIESIQNFLEIMNLDDTSIINIAFFCSHNNTNGIERCKIQIPVLSDWKFWGIDNNGKTIFNITLIKKS